jgi:hypothetical protein
VRSTVASALALALLIGGAAKAQDGCLGLQKLHCGISTSFLGLRQLSASPVPVELGAGPSLEYHFARWVLGGAVFGNSVLALVKNPHPTSEVSACVFVGFPNVPGPLAGLRLGPSVVVAGPNGGLLGGFTWRGSVGLALSGSPELLGYLQLGSP